MNEICPACGSHQTVKGQCHGPLFKAPEIVFTPEHLKMIVLDKTSVNVQGKSKNMFSACIDCGHLWAKIDPKELENKITKYGKR